MPHTYYLNRSIPIAQLKKTVKTLSEVIKAKTPEAAAIAFTGVSGTLVGPAVAMELNLPMLCVRKRGQTHSTYPVESELSSIDIFNYIIVDDTIDSGITIRRIINDIREHHPYAICVGVVLYAHFFEATTGTLEERAGVPVYYKHNL
jgi:adenine/guanine phosphoribosyltransferase-like PRPP-binding protein